jgi:hypothetical protein
MPARCGSFIFLLFYSLGETLPHSADYFVRLLQNKTTQSSMLSGGILLFLNYIESFLLLLWPPAAAAVMIGSACGK